MATPSRRHCSARSGAGWPSQTPGSRLSAAPILPVPDSVGGTARLGATDASSTAALTVSWKLSVAEPPELVTVTVTSAAAIAVSVGRLSTPVAASMLAPAPVTAKLSAPPLKCGASGTTKSPLPCSSSRSPRLPAATGATWVTRTGSVTASRLPAALLAVTAQLISARSSAAIGR